MLNVALTVFIILLSIAATVLSFIFITPEKRKLPGFFAFLRELFNFKYLVVEMVLKALYIFSTICTILSGFFMLFTGFNTWTERVGSYWDGYEYVTHTEYYGWIGIFVMILGPILIRLVYEGIMLTIIAVKNIIEINKKLPNKNRPAPKAEPVPQTPIEPAPIAFCTFCGSRLDNNGKCPVCGK